MALPSRNEIVERLERTLEDLVTGATLPGQPPHPGVSSHLDTLLRKRQYTLRDGILTLLAMEVQNGEVIDWRDQPIYNPARGASRTLGSTIYPRLHIVGSPEALQTGVKGVGTYIDRNNPTWRAILEWASVSPLEEVEAAFLYLAGGIAKTARNLPPLPELDTPRLTFRAVFALLDDMLARPSAGAHEQFMFAAFLEAWRGQLDEPGVVDTKNLNASDASAGTAGDVQERHRGQVTEAYEVTANGFDSKVDQAVATLKRHDLRRVHIVARGAAGATGGEIAMALPEDSDITVLDIREDVRSMLARLRKPHRREALALLYSLLSEKQPDDALVQEYVEALVRRGLTASR